MTPAPAVAGRNINTAMGREVELDAIGKGLQKARCNNP